MESVTLLELKKSVRYEADQENSNFITDDELKSKIYASIRTYYNQLTEAVEDYNLTTESFTISSGSSHNLPANFYKLRGVDDMSYDRARTVRKFNFAARNDFGRRDSFASLCLYSEIEYRLEGDTIEFSPPERAQRSYRMFYTPTVVLPAGDNDTLTVLPGMQEFIYLDAAIACLNKEESNPAGLQQRLALKKEEFTRMKAERDNAMPEKVTRTRQGGNDPYYRYGYGP